MTALQLFQQHLALNEVTQAQIDEIISILVPVQTMPLQHPVPETENQLKTSQTFRCDLKEQNCAVATGLAAMERQNLS